MNKLKSIFISTYLAYAITIAIFQLIWFFDSLDFVWLTSAVTHLLPVSFFARLFLSPVPRTGRKLNFITIGIIGLTLMTMLIISSTPFSYPLLFTYLVITFAGWLLYLNWYSILPKRSRPLTPGDLLPELTLESEDKSAVATSGFIGRKTLYLFYRGNWCPLCMAQVKEIAEQYRELDKLGVQIVLISPQPHRYSANLATKFDVPFVFLSDPKNKAAKRIGIQHDGGTPFGIEVFGYSSDTVLPTVIITDEKGKIIFVDQTDHYRIRPEPKVFLDILQNEQNSTGAIA